MNIVDANVLLYAANTAAERHHQARSWLDSQLSGAGTVGFSWVALLAFLRLSTKAGLFPAPLPVAEALARVQAWSSAHFTVLSGLLLELGSGGNLTNDAHLAALAVEHRGTVITYDNDVSRCRGVRWATPTG